MTKNNLILCIETTSEVCSVALSENGECLHQLTIIEPNAHGTHLTVLIDKLLQQSNFSLKQIHAVAYSSGPGSYTGLRIGLSTAKGICMGNDIPLIDIPTLLHMTAKAIHLRPDMELYLPMIDARRMEVYTATFNKELETLNEPFACLLEEYNWNLLEKYNSIAYFGNGSEKAQRIFSGRKQFNRLDTFKLDASSLCLLAYKRYLTSHFANLALHVPFYLKAANVTASKKTTL